MDSLEHPGRKSHAADGAGSALFGTVGRGPWQTVLDRLRTVC